MQKRIGIVISSIYKEINREQLRGILERAYEVGFSAYVFTLGEGGEDASSQKGEQNIFRLINFSLLDGIVYLPYTFTKMEQRQFVDDFLRTDCPVPLAMVSSEEEALPSVWYDDRRETAEVVAHLIEVHGCRDILYLTGREDAPVSHRRAAGYRDAMEAAGLPYDPRNVIYGDFWVESARQLAQELARGIRPVPQAVACANDYMAISLCDALKERGIAVPERVRVIGYDGTVEAFVHEPQVSTYHTSWRQLGRDAMDLLLQGITGQPVPERTRCAGFLLARHTCGCKSTVKDDAMVPVNYRRMEESYVDKDLTTRLYAAGNLKDFLVRVFESTYVFMNESYWDNQTYTLCLSEDWSDTMVSGEELAYRSEGYSDRILEGYPTPDGTLKSFPVSQMVPDGWNDTKDCSVTFFNAMHFEDRCFGYSILRITGIPDGYTGHYVRFRRDVSNGLMFLCTQNRMRSLAYHHYLSQIRDELTGLYNARGFGRLWMDVTKEAAVCDEIVFLLCLSVSGLRQVQEMCGSVVCDKLMMDFAGILQGCCENRERCVRMGMADFAVMGTEKPPARSSSVIAGRLLERFEAYIRRTEYPIRLHILEMMKVWESAPFPDPDAAASEADRLLRAAAAKRPSYSEQMRYHELTSLRSEIYRSPGSGWTTAACAERLGLSMTHFQRVYQKTFGISCAHDIRKSKLTHAKELLIRTRDTLEEIAVKCGYDYAHFMRVFRSETGMTPTEYRRGAGRSRRRSEDSGE